MCSSTHRLGTLPTSPLKMITQSPQPHFYPCPQQTVHPKSLRKMSLARLSTIYMALRRDRTDSTSSSSERLPLSDSSEDYRDESFNKPPIEECPHYMNHQRQPPFQWTSLCFHLILALIYGAAFLAATYRSTSNINHQDSKPAHLIACKPTYPTNLNSNSKPTNITTLAPLWEAIELERKTINASIESENPFKGAPSEKLDHAWHQLFINSNVRVTAEDLAKINRTSVPINDEKGGYYAIPGMFKNSHMRSSDR